MGHSKCLGGGHESSVVASFLYGINTCLPQQASHPERSEHVPATVKYYGSKLGESLLNYPYRNVVNSATTDRAPVLAPPLGAVLAFGCGGLFPRGGCAPAASGLAVIRFVPLSLVVAPFVSPPSAPVGRLRWA